MTQKEFARATLLVSSLRNRLAHANALKDSAEKERNELAAHVSAHVDALKQSNAQCGEYLRQNEQLHSQLAETTKDLAYSRLAVDTMCARDKRFKDTGARCGAKDGEDIGDFIERACADRDTLHAELVDVRAALASVSAERDSLKRTLKEWEEAETKPHVRVAADDIADHVVPPVLPLCMTCHGCGSVLEDAGAELLCPCPDCDLYGTKDNLSPYLGPCKSKHSVRHE